MKNKMIFSIQTIRIAKMIRKNICISKEIKHEGANYNTYRFHGKPPQSFLKSMLHKLLFDCYFNKFNKNVSNDAAKIHLV